MCEWLFCRRMDGWEDEEYEEYEEGEEGDEDWDEDGWDDDEGMMRKDRCTLASSYPKNTRALAHCFLSIVKIRTKRLAKPQRRRRKQKQ